MVHLSKRANVGVLMIYMDYFVRIVTSRDLCYVIGRLMFLCEIALKK